VRGGAVLAVAGLLALGLPATVDASTEVVSDPESAQGELVNNTSLWARVVAQITFSTAHRGDRIVALTVPSAHPCPRRPAASAQSYRAPGAAAQSFSVLADGETEQFSLTPTRRQVDRNSATRVCAYLLRTDVVRARASRRLTVALSPFAATRSHGAPGTNGKRDNGASLLEALLVVLAVIGVAGTARRLIRRARRRRTELSTPPSTPPSTAAAETSTWGTAPLRGGRPAPARETETVRVLRQVSFSKHAIEQFATRAGLDLASHYDMELLVRELLRHEGRVTTVRPFWSRSSNTADLYLQAGEWMLFILVKNVWRPWRYTCVTAVNGRDDNTWERALQRGYIHMAPRDRRWGTEL
jgi:hypothetical protein